MGAAGPAIVFVCLFALLVIAGAFLISFAGRAFFVVVQQTSAGTEEVTWPDEPMMDWIGQGAQFLWLVGVWFCPVAMVLRVINPNIFSDDAGLFVSVSGLTLWVFFPIGALSAMSAGSRWIVFNPKMVIALVRIAPVTLAFYVVSSVPLAAALAAFYGAMGSLGFAPLAGALGAAALLIYARLLGRVAWKLNHNNTGRRRKREKTRASKPQTAAVEVRDSWGPAPTKRKKKKRAQSEESVDEDKPIPLAAPEVEQVTDGIDDEPAVLEAGAASGYGLAENAAGAPEPVSSYDALDPEPTPNSKSQVTAKQIVGDDLEDRLVPQHDPDKPPPLLLLSGVFEFPWLPMSARHWLSLTILGTIVTGLLRLAIEYFPR